MSRRVVVVRLPLWPPSAHIRAPPPPHCRGIPTGGSLVVLCTYKDKDKTAGLRAEWPGWDQVLPVALAAFDGGRYSNTLDDDRVEVLRDELANHDKLVDRNALLLTAVVLTPLLAPGQKTRAMEYAADFLDAARRDTIACPTPPAVTPQLYVLCTNVQAALLNGTPWAEWLHAKALQRMLYQFMDEELLSERGQKDAATRRRAVLRDLHANLLGNGALLTEVPREPMSRPWGRAREFAVTVMGGRMTSTHQLEELRRALAAPCAAL